MNALLRFLVLMLIIISLTACSGDAPAPPPVLGSERDLEPGTTAVLTCSSLCDKKSQCGSSDIGQVVLGGASEPLVKDWNLHMPAGASISIDERSIRTVEKLSDQTREQLAFYKVTLADQSKSGWIAGWCVGVAE